MTVAVVEPVVERMKSTLAVAVAVLLALLICAPARAEEAQSSTIAKAQESEAASAPATTPTPTPADTDASKASGAEGEREEDADEEEDEEPDDQDLSLLEEGEETDPVLREKLAKLQQQLEEFEGLSEEDWDKPEVMARVEAFLKDTEADRELPDFDLEVSTVGLFLDQ